MPRVSTSAKASDPRPRFCPNPGCQFHKPNQERPFRVIRKGRRSTRRDPKHPNPRYRCKDCGRWFCGSTFTLDYWRKLPKLAERLFPLINNGQALRQAARSVGCHVNAVLLTQRKLAKQSLLLHLLQERRLVGQLKEPLVLDGQRNLVNSKHQMAEINSLYTATSGYTLALDPFGIRQGVGQDPERLKQREESEALWGTPDPKARRKATRKLLRRVDRLFPAGLEVELRTDQEPDYLAAISRWQKSRPVRHLRISSRTERDQNNPLWMANHKHRLQRHSLANLRRETIAQSKRMRGLQDRLLLLRVWLNSIKGRSERTAAGRVETPAMQLGLESRRLGVRELFRRRLFPVRARLPAALSELYQGLIKGWPKEQLATRVTKFVD